MTEENSGIYIFDKFQLDIRKRLLLCDGQPVPIKSKGFDLLVVLVESEGRVISKEELFEKVWESRFVEDANLTVTMSHLRKTLGDDPRTPRFIATLPGRGYRFVADVARFPDEIVIEAHADSEISIEPEPGDRLPDSVVARVAADPASSGAGNHLINAAPAVKRDRPANYRLKFVYAAAALMTVALVLAVGAHYWRTSKTPIFGKVKLTRLTINGRVDEAAFSPDGKFLAYSMGEADGYSLWIKQVNAANDTRILPPVKASFWDLTFSPDGTALYYNLFTPDQANPKLYRIPTLGGPPQRISDIAAPTITLSPDGRRLAYVTTDSESGNNYLITADADGTNRRNLAVKPQPSTFVLHGRYAAWSPDGQTIACLVNHVEDGANYKSIVAVDAVDGSERSLTEKRWRDVAGLEWLRDGSGLLVSGTEIDAWKTQVWLVTPTGEVSVVLDDLNAYESIDTSVNNNSFIVVQTAWTNSLAVGDAHGAANSFREVAAEIGPLSPLRWMPDGKIVFRSTAGGISNLWTMEADGSNRRQLTADARVDPRGLCVSPDGKYLVFPSGRAGKINLWRVDADGQNLSPLTNGEADAHPVCAPDGKTVVFQRGILTKPTLWKLPIEGGEPVQITDFQSKWSALSHDGKKLAFFQILDDKWQIGIMPAAGGAVLQRLIVPEIFNGNRLEWSADDQSFLMAGAVGNVGNLYRLPLDSGAPVAITNFSSHFLEDFDYSPDGRKLAIARSDALRDVFLVEPVK